MKNRNFAPFVLGCLLALLPSLLSAGPWDPNRARPPGFQRTLAYLANDLYDYPEASLQSARNSMLTEDLMTTMIDVFKKEGRDPSTLEALGQQTYDAYVNQNEQVKTTLRQTKTDPEGIIRAVEGNQPLSADVLEDPLVRALILIKWQMLGVAERTYQAVLYFKGGSSGGSSPPTGIPNPNPPKSGKKSQLDYQQMRRDRQAAIDRRRAIEAKEARENARRWADLNELIRRLFSNEAQSTNKFKQARTGTAASIPALQVAVPAEPEGAAASNEPVATNEPASTDPTPPPNEPPDKPAKAEPKKTVKIKTYQGTFTLTRPEGLGEDVWKPLKDAFIATMGQTPGASDMKDAGGVMTWKYKGKVPGDQIPGLGIAPPMFIYTGGETIEEEVADDGSVVAPLPPKKKGFEENGPLTEADLRGKDVPGSGPQYAPKPDKFSTKPKPEPTKPEPAKTAAVPGYWFDPSDRDNDKAGSDPYIYVRVDGEAVRVRLSEAKGYGVLATATIENMTHYNESTGKITKNNDAHTNRGN